MGKILSGILGGFSGKVGPVVGGKWKDIDYMRSYVIPSNPNTPGQQTVRTKFAKLVEMSRGLLAAILQPYWDPFQSSMSGFNAWISANYSLLDGSNLLTANNIMSKGTLEGLYTIIGSYVSGTGVVTVTWDGDIFGNGLGTDNVMLIAVDKSTNRFYFDNTGQTRSSASGTINIAPSLTATNIIVYAFAYRGTGSELVVSDSSGDVCSAG